jgi:hypothetical protein
VAAVLGSLFVLLSVPSTDPALGIQVVDPHAFPSQPEERFGAGDGWLNYTFHGVTFGFHLRCQVGPAAGTICGNATEASGARFPYSFSDDLDSEVQTWVAPDFHQAVEYQSGGHADLPVGV